MHIRALTTTLTAATLTVTVSAGPLAAAAHAAPPSETTVVFLDSLPCQPETELFEITLVTRDRLHEHQTAARYHENSRSAGTFSAVPVQIDELSGEVTRRAGSSWAGRMVLIHTANNGSAGAGHAVSTFRLHISGTSDTGERLHSQEFAHYTGTAVPDDPSAVVRRFFSRSVCR